jgi:streptogramin lyase
LSSLAVGPEGDVWFTDLSFESLGRMTPAGAVTMFPLRRFQSASDVVAGADGGIWFTIDGDSTADAAIGHIGASGAVAETPVPGDDVILRGIAAGPEGSIWFADSLEDKIRQIAPDGVLSETEVPGIPEGVAAAPGGDIWFTEFPGTRIGMITPQRIVSEFPIPRLPRCIVPNLWGKTLVQAHRALRRADCKLGRIRRAHGRPRRPPRVVMQAPYATAVYPRGAAVSIRLR